MKYLFIVQGEGRGHLTQALALEKILRRNGHEVIEMLVGKSSVRTLPGFFNRNVRSTVKRFISPNFLPTAQNKRVKMSRSIVYNLMRIPVYLKSMLYIRRRIKDTQADVVVNFYELLTGLTYALSHPSVPCICIGHQYLFLHEQFEFPEKNKGSLFLLRFFTRLTAMGSQKKLALSFRQMEDDEKRKIMVVPPLLREEVYGLQPETGNYFHGYMVNSGFADSVVAYHFRHPERRMHFFWDKPDVEEEQKISDHLTFHRIDDIKFLRYMAGCSAYASTAGFESICEAMYLGKPVLMVPAHIEQDCNAHDAVKAGAGISAEDFDLDRLENFVRNYKTDRRPFIYWAKSSERLMLRELEKVTGPQPVISLFSSIFR